MASGFSSKNETYHVVIFNLWVRASVDTSYCRDRTMQISHSLTRSRRTSGPNSTVGRSIVSEEARPPRSWLGSKSSLTLLRLFSLWQIFYSTVRGLTGFKTRRSLDLGIGRGDEHLLFESPRSRGNTNSSWLESDLKVRKCHAMLFFESLYEPKTDRLDHRCRRKFHGKGGKLKTFHRRYVRVLKGRYQSHFPAHFFSKSHFPVLKSHSH